MNLIYEPWIPVRRADGSRETIAPWQLTEGIAGNPVVAVASPRPDFDGALTQFLIGLLQTNHLHAARRIHLAQVAAGGACPGGVAREVRYSGACVRAGG